ncbi:MAG: UvrD-helicase domain-containing protein [Chloroflexi bacterium]|nr:UvrD-helicase domain-containing protein [Chloroflexota bacterium]
MATAILEGLNLQQQEAVEHIEGPLLIVAGPGSGKTRVITRRIAYLVKVCGVSPRRILAVTFTNKAAREMQERLFGKSEKDPGAPLLDWGMRRDLIVSTFHAFCASVLRREGEPLGLTRDFTIYDGEDQLSVVRQAMEEAELDPKQYAPRAILDTISGAKAQLIDAEGYRRLVQSHWEEIVQQVYHRYQDRLAGNQAVDFDDLLMKACLLFRDHPDVLERYQDRYLHTLIDEFQDTNLAQYELARQLAGRHRNLCVVGDPDQSIYSWRHADIRNILSFQRDFPDAKRVTLAENYRSTQVILDAAQHIIAANKERLEKSLFTRRDEGRPIVVHEAYNQDEEAQWVLQEVDRLRKEEKASLKDVAVMYRVNAQSRALEEGCLRYGVPYKLVGALRFYQRREIKDVIAYLRLLVNPQDDVSLLRVLNVPPRGIGTKTQDELVRQARDLGIPLMEALGRVSKGAQEAAFPSAGRAAMTRFYELMTALSRASQEQDLPSLIDQVVERSGYRRHILEEGKEGEERWDNVMEFRASAQEFGDLEPREALTAFLERVALVSDQDNLDETKEGITLTTLHQAKGLEFPVVFMVGMEERLLPHSRSFDDPAEMEEERRLCYVGMTRAKDRLYLVRAFRRNVMGGNQTGVPSRFLQDIPPHLILRPPPAKASAEALWDWSAAPRKEPSPKSALSVGDHVRHAKFGEGIVVNCVPSGSDHEVTVAFKGGGVKRLLLSYAPLEPVE